MPYKPVDRAGLLERGIADTIKTGLITADDNILVAHVNIPVAPFWVWYDSRDDALPG